MSPSFLTLIAGLMLMNSAQAVTPNIAIVPDDEFEISITVRNKKYDIKTSYVISQREIDHGHLPRILKLMKKQVGG